MHRAYSWTLIKTELPLLACTQTVAPVMSVRPSFLIDACLHLKTPFVCIRTQPISWLMLHCSLLTVCASFHIPCVVYLHFSLVIFLWVFSPVFFSQSKCASWCRPTGLTYLEWGGILWPENTELNTDVKTYTILWSENSWQKLVSVHIWEMSSSVVIVVVK